MSAQQRTALSELSPQGRRDLGRGRRGRASRRCRCSPTSSRPSPRPDAARRSSQEARRLPPVRTSGRRRVPHAAVEGGVEHAVRVALHRVDVGTPAQIVAVAEIDVARPPECGQPRPMRLTCRPVLPSVRSTLRGNSMRRMRPLYAALLATLVLVAAGCGSEDVGAGESADSSSPERWSMSISTVIPSPTSGSRSRSSSSGSPTARSGWPS